VGAPELVAQRRLSLQTECVHSLSSPWLLCLAALVFVTACGGEVATDAGSGGAGQAGGSGGAATGGAGSSVGVGGGFLEFPRSTLADDCELTPESTEWGRDHARIECFSTSDFFMGPRQEDFGFPTFPGAGLGGAGGQSGTTVETCPAASALDWTCHVVEGTSCTIPQCELPTTPEPDGGDCCYVVDSVSGV